MNKFEETYNKIIAESKKHIIKEDINQDVIDKVIDILILCKDHFVIPGQVKKHLAEAISLLNSNKDQNEAFEETYTYKDKVIKICKDIGEDNYYFILNDNDILDGDEWVSYDNPAEFDNEEGTWETFEECLKEAKQAGENFWNDFDFNKFKKS